MRLTTTALPLVLGLLLLGSAVATPAAGAVGGKATAPASLPAHAELPFCAGR
jgi:hypothetical protein